MIIIFISLFLGFIIGNRIPYWLGHLLSWFHTRRILKVLLPVPFDENSACQGPHSWIDVNSLNEIGEIIKVQLCGVCGLIPSKNLMATREALIRAHENKKIEEFEEQIQNDFSLIEEENLKTIFEDDLRIGLDPKKLAQAYKLGETTRERFINYKIMRYQMLNDTSKQQDTKEST